MATDIFKQLVSDAGIPTTEAELKAEWQTIAADNDSPYNNDSAYSPFWRVVTALMTTPVLWLINLLITSVLPNFFIKYASGVYLDALAEDREIYRKLEAKTIGNLKFSRTVTAGDLLVPAGTQVQSAAINGTIYALKTLADASFTDGEADIYVPAEALTAGQAYNLASGYYLILISAVAGVTAVTNEADWLTTPGADHETDDELRDRAQNQFNAVNQFHTDAAYLALITTYAALKTSNVWFEHGAPRGAGTANIHILLDVGTPSGAFLTDVQSYVMDQGNHGHGDDLQVLAIPETPHNLVYAYWAVDSLSAAEITQLGLDVESFIRAAFRENLLYAPTITAPWSKFSFSRLAQELHAQFPGLLSVDFSNVDIDNVLAIPRINSLAGTLN